MNALLEMRGIGKRFPGVKALDQVDLMLYPGEVHALLGENGAGKSTLIKILMGIYQRDEGSIQRAGQSVQIASPLDAQALGLAAVYQDVMLSRHLSVAENFFMGKLPLRFGMVDWKGMRAQSERFLRELGIAVDVTALVGELPVAQQQLVAIAKVLWGGAQIVVFDEPTALLTTRETDILFGLIEKLKSQNKAILYVSHRMEEIFRICDTATVLKDGQLVKRVDLKEHNEASLVALMVGRTLTDAFPKRKFHPAGEVRLSARSLNRGKQLRNVSIDVRAGEILGLYGLVGAGRTELMRALFGADAVESGEIQVHGEVVRPRSPRDMIARGVGLICEDRKHQSLAMPMDVLSNINLVRSQRHSRWGVLPQAEELAQARHYIDVLRIRTPSPYQRIENLSGGNQQKAVIGKWLAINADVLLFDEPTIGVDVGARMEIYQLMQALVDQGKAVVMVSSYLPEVIALSDRTMVMYQGQVMGEVPHGQATEERLLQMASGLAG
jgi:ribose transport system ATP-binding protein